MQEDFITTFHHMAAFVAVQTNETAQRKSDQSVVIHKAVSFVSENSEAGQFTFLALN